MKKGSVTLLIVLLEFLLAACGTAVSISSQPVANAQGTPMASNGTPGAFGQETLSASQQVLVGTFKLEGTDQAVTSEQAAELLPLWQTLKVLYESDAAANQEIEALLTQIQETMTSKQMQAISAMNLTRADMFAIMQEQGGMASGSSSSGQSSSRTGQGGFQGTGGGPGMGGPSGGMPPDMAGGGPGMGSGQSLSAEQQATVEAMRTQRAENANRLSTVLIEAVIKLLESKIQ
jgi:uncharacterized membrane protein YgcG